MPYCKKCSEPVKTAIIVCDKCLEKQRRMIQLLGNLACQKCSTPEDGKKCHSCQVQEILRQLLD